MSLSSTLTRLGAVLLFFHSAAGSDATSDARRAFPSPGMAALAQAVTDRDLPKIQALVASGVDLRGAGDGGVNILQWALLKRNPALLGQLVDLGADPSQPGFGGDTVLHMAAMANDISYLRILLDHGADPNARNARTGAPLLSAALMNPDRSAFKLLLQRHANPNLAARFGDTPLHVAAQVHDSECILALLNAGADPTRRNNRGDTFQPYFNLLPAGGLSAAARARHEAVHAWLERHGVPIEGR